jgi:hypothetical protein
VARDGGGKRRRRREVGQGAVVAPPAPGDTEEQPPREQWLAAVGVISRWQVIYILKKENILLVHKTKERRQKRTGGPNDMSFGPLACTHTPCSPCRLLLSSPAPSPLRIHPTSSGLWRWWKCRLMSFSLSSPSPCSSSSPSSPLSLPSWSWSWSWSCHHRRGHVSGGGSGSGPSPSHMAFINASMRHHLPRQTYHNILKL